MRKIPTTFKRDWPDPRHPIRDAPDPACAWVFAGMGVVFHHPDGRMAKAELRDFGLKRGRAAGQASLRQQGAAPGRPRRHRRA